jgi:hypothetical protein
MDKKIKHLEFIQTVIARQAKNSFLLKGWIVTITAAMITFIPKNNDVKPILSVYGLIFIFWILDSYYLFQEKLFRALYDHVRTLGEDEINFDMNTNHFKKKINCTWLDVAISRTLLVFYIPLMIFTIIFFWGRW